MRNQLLLLEDVDDLGRSGDIVSVKPGFARNFLVPQKKAVVADKFTLRMQAKLKEERSKRAELDRNESEELAKKIEGMVLGNSCESRSGWKYVRFVSACRHRPSFRTFGNHIWNDVISCWSTLLRALVCMLLTSNSMKAFQLILPLKS